MKRKLIGFSILAILMVTILFNPIAYYADRQGEKELRSMSSEILEMLELGDRQIKEIHPLGNDIFQLKTDEESFLIQRDRSNGYTEFTIYEQHETTVGRFGGLKPSLFYRIKELLSR